MSFQASNCVAFLLSVADGMYIQEIIAALPSDLKVVDLSAVSKRIPNPLYKKFVDKVLVHMRMVLCHAWRFGIVLGLLDVGTLASLKPSRFSA